MSVLNALIASFRRDEEGHWVAELACGHRQHVRHEPPLQSRPWVLTEAGRASRLGTMLRCMRCLAGEPAAYALEGSIAITGSLVQWFRDQLELIASAPEIETLARSVADNGGCYIVPAFSGLFAPYWRSDARGAIVGLTRYVTKGHLARAALEATAWQTREIVDAMNTDSGVQLMRRGFARRASAATGRSSPRRTRRPRAPRAP